TCGKIAALALARINGNHNTLAAKAFGGFADERGVGDGSAINADLVGAGQQDGAHVLDTADAAAYGEGNKYTVRYAPHHVNHDVARFMRGGDVEKDKFIRASAV